MTLPAYRILIVEDVAEMREYLTALVKSLKGVAAVAAVSQGPDARREWTRDRPDLILLDELLPGESSGDLLLEATALGIPTLLITGIDDSTLPSRPLPPAALGRLSKPEWEPVDRRSANRFCQELLGCLARVPRAALSKG